MQEVIDALETQIDTKLNDTVQGVRVVNGNCYVCLAKEDNAGALLETGLTLRGVKINLEDASRDTVTVALSGVPHDVPDSSVARVVANYGTVIGESKNTHTLTLLTLFKEISPLKTKRRLLYLKAQFVRRSKHFSSLHVCTVHQ